MVKNHTLTTELIMNYSICVITITLIVLFLFYIFGNSGSDSYNSEGFENETIETYEENNTVNLYPAFGLMIASVVFLVAMIYDYIAETTVSKFTSDFIKLIALFFIVFIFSFNKDYPKTKLVQSIFYTFFAICCLIFVLKEFRVAETSHKFINKIADNVDTSTSNIASGSQYLNELLKNLYYTLSNTGTNLNKVGHVLHRDIPALLQKVKKEAPELLTTLIQKIKDLGLSYTLMDGLEVH